MRARGGRVARAGRNAIAVPPFTYEEIAMPQLKVTASSLNVREAPSLQGAIIGSLAHDAVVEQLV